MVPSDPKAIRKLTLWVSVARSAYMLKKAAFRRPKIWMLAGRYLLHYVRAYKPGKLNPKLSAEISPQVSGVVGGPPVRGSLRLGWERVLETDITKPKANIWATQWRLLDTEIVIKNTYPAVGPGSALHFGFCFQM